MSQARICVCTPLYGDPEAAGLSKAYTGTLYAFGSDLSVLCGEDGWDSGDIELDASSPYPNSIEHARNYLVKLFLEHPRNYTHALLWDSDEQGSPNQIAKLIMRMVRADVPIASVPSVEKFLHWEKAAEAVRFEMAAGHSHTTDRELADVIRGAACRYLPDPLRSVCRLGSVGADDFAEMVEGYVSLGFALVRRDVFERLTELHRAELTYDFRDHEGKPIEVVGLFHTTVLGRRLAMEDMAFCDRARAAGFGQYLYVGEGSPIDHVGRTVFRGTREAMLRDWHLR